MLLVFFILKQNMFSYLNRFGSNDSRAILAPEWSQELSYFYL